MYFSYYQSPISYKNIYDIIEDKVSHFPSLQKKRLKYFLYCRPGAGRMSISDVRGHGQGPGQDRSLPSHAQERSRAKSRSRGLADIDPKFISQVRQKHMEIYVWSLISVFGLGSLQIKWTFSKPGEVWANSEFLLKQTTETSTYSGFGLFSVQGVFV